MNTGLPFAFIENFQEGFVFAVKVFLTVVAAVVGWFVATPLAHLLFRIAYHRRPGYLALLTSRFACATIFAVLAFLYIAFGPGGGGWGPGGPGWGGLGGGGAGQGGGVQAVTGKDKDAGKGEARGKGGPEPEPEKKTIAIQMVLSREYEPNSGKYYVLLGEGGGAARTFEQVRDYLVEHKDEIRKVEVRVYANSMTDQRPEFELLRELVERQLDLQFEAPEKYRTQVKS